jgi:hypothetical protein
MGKVVTKAKQAKQPRPEGLIGLYGHTYIVDPHDRDERMIRYQFQIIRRMGASRYVFQYFSFIDGSPTQVGVMSETELLGPDVKLYADEETWREIHREEADMKRLDRQVRLSAVK